MHNTVFGHVVAFLVIVPLFRSGSILSVDSHVSVQPPHHQILSVTSNFKNNNTMKFKFENLDQQTRELMISEINTDIEKGLLYFSKRFNDTGRKLYAKLLLDSVSSGDEETLANSLKSNNCFAEKEARNGKNGVTYAKIPETASQTLAESEFNRFYIRGLALRAIASSQTLTIYRARHSDNPRTESEIMIGQKILADKVLNDLRINIGVDTALGLPVGPNSGLSVKLS